MARVILAFGSNLGDRSANLRCARSALAPQFVLGTCSRVYETEPAHVLEQPRFYNQVGLATTQLSPQQALARLKQIESELGRVPGRRFGPRQIDLDLLFYDDRVIDTHDLVLPHPRLAERPFVLVPLAEVAPDLVHPQLGLTVMQLLARLGDTNRTIWPVES